MNPTKIDLSQETREKVVSLLQDCLSDSIDLLSQTKQAHWNVKGPSFIGLHKLFDEVHEAIEGHVDEIAERLVTLGGYAYGTTRMAAKGTNLKPYPDKITSGRDHADALSTALADFGREIRAAIGKADKLGDEGTVDLLTGVSRTVDQYTWFVEAHLQGDS